MHGNRRETLRLIAAGALAGAAPVSLAGPALAQKQPDPAVSPAPKQLRLAMVVKALGIGFFDAVHAGGTEAAKELGNVDLVYAGPVKATAEDQIKLIDPLVAQHVDAIMIAAGDPRALAPTCKKAMQRGVKVVSFESAVAPDGRIMHLDPASPALVGSKCVQMMAKTLGNAGAVAILSTTPEAASQNAWIVAMKKEWVKPEYAAMKLAATAYGGDAADKSYGEAQSLLKAYPGLRGIVAPTPVGIVAAAKAVMDANLVGKVFVTGLGLPSEMKDAVLAGATETFAGWSPIDLGYAITMIAAQIVMGDATGTANTSVNAGRMGEIKIAADATAAMAAPLVFDKANVETFAKLF